MPARDSATRPRLSRERVLQGAVAVADAGGIASLTIRSLATELGVKPMSVYHHVANKEEILDGIVDLVFAEIELPTIGGDWHEEMRRRAASAREAMRRHPWAIGLVETRTSPGWATLKHHNAVIGTLREAGFSSRDDRPCIRPDRRLRLRLRPVRGDPAHQRARVRPLRGR